MPLLGAHVSIAGGLEKAIERGDALGCDCIQIFVASSRTWALPPLTQEGITLFRATAKKAKSVRRIVAHNSYLLNLSTADSVVRKKSVKYFIDIMNRCEALGVEGLITHPGSHLGAGEDEGIRATAQSFKEILQACSGFQTEILIENTAGQGGCIGHRFEHLGAIAEGSGAPEKIFYCFDTQHAFAAGYDLRTEEVYKSTFKEFEKHLGKGRIRAFHLNDALKEFGCRVDRHQNIGQGFLGKTPFKLLLEDKRFAAVPMCIETDPGEDDEKHKADLRYLRSLLSCYPLSPSIRR